MVSCVILKYGPRFNPDAGSYSLVIDYRKLLSITENFHAVVGVIACAQHYNLKVIKRKIMFFSAVGWRRSTATFPRPEIVTAIAATADVHF